MSRSNSQWASFSCITSSHCELIQLGAAIASAHHERWDGTGYPNRLGQTEIPIAARVVAVADVFDALTTKRPYKEAMSLKDAMDYLIDHKGRQFDPACVDAFLSRWNEVEAIATARSYHPALEPHAGWPCTRPSMHLAVQSMFAGYCPSET